MREDGSDDAEKGVFTAKAELNANFGDDSAAGSVSGTVSKFSGEGSHNLSSWHVTLGSVTLTSGSAQITEGSVVGDDSRADGRHWTSGAWSGAFFGNGEETTDHPTSIAGQFDARWGSPEQMETGDTGYVGIGGAFGAQFVEPPEDEEDGS